MPDVLDLRTSDKLRAYLRQIVTESIESAADLDDPGATERMYQQSIAKGVGAAGKTARAKTGSAKPADKKAPAKQVEPNEAEEDDIFAGSGGDDDSKKPDSKPAKTEKPAAPTPDAAPAKDAGEAPRKNRNSPEAAKFSLADAQTRAKEKEQHAASVVPTPKPEDLSFDMVVTALNIMRSGQSLKDERVKGEVERYFTSLKGAERVALYSYLNGLAQIVAANVPSAQAPSPDDTPNPVSMEFSKGEPSSSDQKNDQSQPKKGHVEPQKKPGSDEKKSKKEPEDDLEDTTPPISVGPREGRVHNRPRL